MNSLQSPGSQNHNLLRGMARTNKKTLALPLGPLKETMNFVMGLVMIGLVLFICSVSNAQAESSVRPPANAVKNVINKDAAKKFQTNRIPGAVLNRSSDSDTWRAIRHGVKGNVSIPDTKAGVLVQDSGESYRAIRNGPLFSYLGFSMLATLILLAIFFAWRGKIKVDKGLSGRKIKRFSTIERTGHWLMAISFIILGISGLNITFGKSVILPIIGKDAFGPFTYFLKLTHNYIAFAFMLGLIIAFVCWVMHNLPNRGDINWILKGGGIFKKGEHPPAGKFNAGQKLIFWAVMIGGLSLSVSGWALMFPFEYSFFSSTMSAFSAIGLDVGNWLGMGSAPYSVIQEQQYNNIWHAIMGVLMICLILAHIYIGSIGMEGAYDAMGSGDVDENWALEHHSLWVEEVKAQERNADGANVQAAE
ncbi:MAG: formate dehydrogenase subunit gamma [Rhodomicrobiaceae bacterium]